MTGQWSNKIWLYGFCFCIRYFDMKLLVELPVLILRQSKREANLFGCKYIFYLKRVRSLQ